MILKHLADAESQEQETNKEEGELGESSTSDKKNNCSTYNRITLDNMDTVNKGSSKETAEEKLSQLSPSKLQKASEEDLSITTKNNQL